MITDIWAIQSLGPTEQSPFSPNRSLPQTPHRLPQRNRDRERAQARKPNAKDPQDGLTSEQRRERDKKALEEKAAKKAAQAAGGGTSTDNKNKAGGAKK
ncbi:hypothetical protein OsJ_01878 [Oryza sativa Japonica Group]|uniref:Small EDRK-rich factor-like N-terminal domain-containing protein n=1 Tax=Oryza sativa subsp. japonica TaxID=39947 RepID=B9EWX1_ORYSJ|nr:hypothetical protein OsJ_01878 [Oryza sativa Japonica Group]